MNDNYWKHKYEEKKEQEEFNETFSARIALIFLVIGLIVLAVFFI